MRVALGGVLNFNVRTKDANRTPTAPAAAPTFNTYHGDVDAGMSGGSGTMTQVGATTLYRAGITCSSGNGFSSGNSYTIVVDYTTGGTARSEEIVFYVD